MELDEERERLEDRLLELYEQNDKDEREYAERFGE